MSAAEARRKNRRGQNNAGEHKPGDGLRDRRGWRLQIAIADRLPDGINVENFAHGLTLRKMNQVLTDSVQWKETT